MNYLPPNKVEQAQDDAQLLRETFAKSFSEIANAMQADDASKGKETDLNEIANMVKFHVAISYVNQQLLNHDRLLVSTPLTDDLNAQFGLVCSRSFINSAFKEFSLALANKEYKDSAQRITILINHMSSIKLAEQGILDTMGGRVDFVDNLRTAFLAMNIFGMEDIPQELLDML